MTGQDPVTAPVPQPISSTLHCLGRESRSATGTSRRSPAAAGRPPATPRCPPAALASPHRPRRSWHTHQASATLPGPSDIAAPLYRPAPPPHDRFPIRSRWDVRPKSHPLSGTPRRRAAWEHSAPNYNTECSHRAPTRARPRRARHGRASFPLPVRPTNLAVQETGAVGLRLSACVASNAPRRRAWRVPNAAAERRRDGARHPHRSAANSLATPADALATSAVERWIADAAAPPGTDSGTCDRERPPRG